MSTEKKQVPAVVETERTIVDNVLSKITQFQETGELVLPKDYIAENALKSAYLMLSEATTKEGVPFLKACTNISIANSLLDMVVQGLSPLKKQCYFIPYGNSLQLQRSYLGSIAMAKRLGLDSIVANVVYEVDEFSYKIDNQTGLVNIISHVQTIDNIDITKIRGAYAIVKLTDGTSNVIVMTIAQIRLSWMQGYAKGKSGAHTNFTDEMCKKTVINRACKMIINSSTDRIIVSELDDDDQPEQKTVTTSIKKEIDIEPFEEQVVVVEPTKNETPKKADF